MSVQAENAFDCVEKITSLEENLQNQIKVLIEAVLKECDNGKIDSNNLTRVLCQSGSWKLYFTLGITVVGGIRKQCKVFYFIVTFFW